MSKLFKRFFNDKNGATAFEYSLLACLVGLVIYSSVNSLGNKLSNGLTNMANKLK